MEGLCRWLDAAGLAESGEIRGPIRHLPPKSVLYDASQRADSYYVVLSGWLALEIALDNGFEMIIDFAMPGATIGNFGNAPRTHDHTATCLTPVTVCSLPRAAMNALATRSPAVAVGLADQAAEQAARSNAHLANIAGRNAHDRIAHLLLELFRRVTGHYPSSPGQTVNLPLQMNQIGRATNLTHVHASRMLAQLRDEGFLRWSGHQLEILDPEALMRLARIDTPAAQSGRRRDILGGRLSA